MKLLIAIAVILWTVLMLEIGYLGGLEKLKSSLRPLDQPQIMYEEA